MVIIVILILIFLMLSGDIGFEEVRHNSSAKNSPKTLESKKHKKDKPKKGKFYDEPGMLNLRMRRSREKIEKNDDRKIFVPDPVDIFPHDILHISSCLPDGQRIFVVPMPDNQDRPSSNEIQEDQLDYAEMGIQASIETQAFETQAIYVHPIVEDSTSQTESMEKSDYETQFNPSSKPAETQCIHVEQGDYETQITPETTPMGTMTVTSTLDDTATQTDIQLESVSTMTVVSPTSISETQTETHETQDTCTNTPRVNLDMFENSNIIIHPTKKILSDAETSTDTLLSLSENKSSIMGSNNSSVVLDENLNVSDESMPHLVGKDMKISGLNRPTALKKSLSLESPRMDEEIKLELSKSVSVQKKSSSFEDLNESDSSKFSILTELKKSVVFPKVHHIQNVEEMREPDIESIKSSLSKKASSSFSDLNENEIPNLSDVKTVRSSFKSECSDDNEV